MYPTGGVGSARLGGGANSCGRSSGRSSDILSMWLAGAIRTSLYHKAPSAVLFRLARIMHRVDEIGAPMACGLRRFL